jgi:alpha-tubulin suppressor-like RCC1 family protein
MAFTKITNTNLSTNVTTSFANSASVAEFATSLAPKVTTVNVANSAFAVLDDTAVNVGGGYIVVTGTNFQSGVTVLIDTTPASAVTRVNDTTLNVQVPAKTASSYNLYVVNPDGGTGIRVSGISYSANPNWVTTSPLTNQANNVAFNLNFSATSATSYAVANGSSLPAGTALLSNGYFYGTVTIGSETVYSFDVVATDAENQDSPKTFGLTVTVPIPRLLYALGNLGYGSTAGYNSQHYGEFTSPIQLTSTTDWSEVTMAKNSVIGVKKDGTLWAWGKNGTGQLGLNFLSSEAAAPYGVSSPTQVGSDTNWYKCFSGIANSNLFTLALKTDGTLWSWGYSGTGSLGNVTPGVDTSSPVQIGTDSNWSDALALGNGSLAIKTNGTLWAWGSPSYGSLGLNDNIAKSSPVQVGALTNWSKFIKTNTESTRDGSKAIKTDGTLWTIGGFNHTINENIFASSKSSPVQYGTDTDWATGAIASDKTALIAIKTNGTMWALGGVNNVGTLGINNTISRSSPVQIGTDTNWSKVFAFYAGVYATKTTGTLWAWGSNFEFLGFGDYGSNHKSNPTQIGSSTGWVSVNGSGIGRVLTRDQP